MLSLDFTSDQPQLQTSHKRLDKVGFVVFSEPMKDKINRQEIIAKLIFIPLEADKRFWQKEMVFFKRLEKKFSIDFWAQFQPDQKFPTLAFYFAKWKQKLLEIEFKEFYYSRLHQQDFSTEQKIGKDAKITTKKTIKQFLS